MAHPLHGTKPLAAKLRQAREWGSQGRSMVVYKLVRGTRGKDFQVLRGTDGCVVMFSGGFERDAKDRMVPGREAIAWASSFPGWTAAFL